MKSKLSFAVQANCHLIVNFVSKKTRSRDSKIAFLVNEYLGILKKVDLTLFKVTLFQYCMSDTMLKILPQLNNEALNSNLR